MDYKEYGFELVDEEDKEWELKITDKTKVKEISEKLNYPDYIKGNGNTFKVNCSIYDENCGILLFNNATRGIKMSIEELINIIK